MEKIEHIGIAVKNLKEANNLYKKLLGVEHYKMEEVASERVKTSFFRTGESKIELLEGINENMLYPTLLKNGERVFII